MPTNKIYIALDHKNTILSIVAARSQELAEAFWQGQDLIPNKVEDIDINKALEDHPTGVLRIAKVEMKREGFMDSNKKITNITR